jgi:predicted ATPase
LLQGQFGQTSKLSTHAFRALALWLLGYPKASQADIRLALKEARELGHAIEVMLVLGLTNYTNLLLRDHVTASEFANELDVLAAEKGAPMRKGEAMFHRGCVLAETGRAPEAIQMITSGIMTWRATGATLWTPLHMSFLASAYSKLGQLDEAWRCIREAFAASESSKEIWCDAEIHRIAGETALLVENRDIADAEAYFERGIAIARQQQARSFELRATMSLARLWRDQGKRSQARNLLAPAYGWFSEGFDTHDLKEAKALLDALAP